MKLGGLERKARLRYKGLRKELGGIQSKLPQLSEKYSSQHSKLFKLIGIGQIQLVERKFSISPSPSWINIKKPPLLYTPIFIAVRQRRQTQAVAVADILIKNGADVNSQNKMGQTVLFYAIAYDQLRTCQLLLQKGANPQLKDKCGQTALQYARSLRKLTFVQQITRHIQLAKSDVLIAEEKIQATNLQTKPKYQLGYQLNRMTSNGKIVTISSEGLKKIDEKGENIQLLRNPEWIIGSQVQQGDTWRLIGLKIIQRLCSQQKGFWFRHCSQVWRLGDNKKNLLDLSVIGHKIEHYIYNSSKCIDRDIKLMYQDFQQTLGKKHPVTLSAQFIYNKYFQLAQQYVLHQS